MSGKRECGETNVLHMVLEQKGSSLNKNKEINEGKEGVASSGVFSGV